MADYTIPRLIELACDDPGPGSKTHDLIRKAAKLLLPEKSRTRIWELLRIFAEREAAMVLMEEALQECFVVSMRNGILDPKYYDVRKSIAWHVSLSPIGAVSKPMDVIDWPAGEHSDLARAILIAVLRAKQAMEVKFDG